MSEHINTRKTDSGWEITRHGGACKLAHTNPDPSYPGYINVAETDSGVRIIVRGDPVTGADGVIEAPTVQLTVTPDAWAMLLKQLR
jgi:hypothetical protein